MDRFLETIGRSPIGWSWYFFWIWFWYGFFHLCRGQMEFKNPAIVNCNDDYILAINHGSYLDWLFVYTMFLFKFNIKVSFFAKEKLYFHPFFFPFIRRAPCIKCNNDGSANLTTDILRQFKKAKFIGIFPEATRSRSGELIDFKSGVIKIAAMLNRKIIPVKLIGLHEAWPPEKKFSKPHPCKIIIGKPYSIEATSRKHLTPELINSELFRLRREIQSLG